MDSSEDTKSNVGTHSVVKPEGIEFKIVGKVSGEMSFKTSLSTMIGEIRASYKRQISKEITSLTLFFNGHVLIDYHTLEQLGMQDHDVIDAVTQYDSYFHYRKKLTDGSMAAGLHIFPFRAKISRFSRVEPEESQEIHSFKYKKPAPMASSLRNMTDQMKSLSVTETFKHSEPKDNLSINADVLSIKLRVPEPGSRKHRFRIGASTPMGQIRHLYSQKVGVPITSFMLSLDSSTFIDDTDTPEQLGLEYGQSIDVITDDASYSLYHIHDIPNFDRSGFSYFGHPARFFGIETNTRPCGDDEFEFIFKAKGNAFSWNAGSIQPKL